MCKLRADRQLSQIGPRGGGVFERCWYLLGIYPRGVEAKA
jgi:hypothetical protein